MFVGRAGVIGAIDIGGVLGDGADDFDVYPLFTSSVHIFDDLTPLVPEPSSLILSVLGALAFPAFCHRRRRAS